MKSEYESKYGRVLWDQDTRSNYFQLVNERKNRMWVSANHTPIRWDQSPRSAKKKEEKVISTEEEKQCNPQKSVQDKNAGTKTEKVSDEKPEPAKTPTDMNCTCSPQSCCLQRINSHIKEVSDSNKWGCFVQIEVNPSKQSLAEPMSGKKPENTTQKQRHSKPKLKSELPKSVIPKNVKTTQNVRPISAPPSMENIVAKKEDKAAKSPPFAMFGRRMGSDKQTFNVSPKKEVKPTALRAKQDREKLRKGKGKSEKKNSVKQGTIPMKLFGEALFTMNKAHKAGLWVTEYQRNYKPFVY